MPADRAEAIRARIAIVEACAAAFLQRDALIAIIGDAEDRAAAQEATMSLLGLDAERARAVLDQRLMSLTAGAQRSLRQELSDLREVLRDAG